MTKVQLHDIAPSGASDGQVPKFNNATQQYEPGTPGGTPFTSSSSSFNTGTVYTAPATGGFLVVRCTNLDSGSGAITILSDAVNPPTTVVGVGIGNAGSVGNSVSCPILPNMNWKVVVSGGGTTTFEIVFYS